MQFKLLAYLRLQQIRGKNILASKNLSMLKALPSLMAKVALKECVQPTEFAEVKGSMLLKLFTRMSMKPVKIGFFLFFIGTGCPGKVPTNTGSAHVLGKEFPTSAPWVIQGESPQSNGPYKFVCTQSSNLKA